MGRCKRFRPGTTPFAIAESISPRLAQAAVVARIRPLQATPAAAGSAEGSEASMYGAENPQAERLVDLSTPLQENVALQLITERDPDALKVLRHSAAHVMATAVTGAVSRDQAGARAGDGCRVLLRFLAADAVYSRRPEADRRAHGGSGGAR